MNAYLRWVEAPEARAGMQWIDRMTGCELSNARGGVMAH